jgi:glycosyltransferase involved in cell wall biosynthesis
MSADTPRVSVVIPCYNGERFVSEAIESVLRQTWGDFELIVVDDGSADASVDIIKRYLVDNRVRLIQHDSNHGIAAARNTGIRNATGKYIGFLDQDDLWRENKLAAQLDRSNYVDKDGPDVVFADVDIERVGAGRRARRHIKVPVNIARLQPDELLSRLFLSDFISIGSALIRKECFETVGLLDENIRSGSDDFELFTRLAQRYRFVYVDKPLAIRRVHDENYTDAEKMVPDVLKILDRNLTVRPALLRIEKRARSRLLYMLARNLHEKGERSRATRAYKDAVWTKPFQLKPVLTLILCRTGKAGDVVLGAINRFRGASI